MISSNINFAGALQQQAFLVDCQHQRWIHSRQHALLWIQLHINNQQLMLFNHITNNNRINQQLFILNPIKTKIHHQLSFINLILINLSSRVRLHPWSRMLQKPRIQLYNSSDRVTVDCQHQRWVPNFNNLLYCACRSTARQPAAYAIQPDPDQHPLHHQVTLIKMILTILWIRPVRLHQLLQKARNQLYNLSYWAADNYFRNNHTIASNKICGTNEVIWVAFEVTIYRHSSICVHYNQVMLYFISSVQTKRRKYYYHCMRINNRYRHRVMCNTGREFSLLLRKKEKGKHRNWRSKYSVNWLNVKLVLSLSNTRAVSQRSPDMFLAGIEIESGVKKLGSK